MKTQATRGSLIDMLTGLKDKTRVQSFTNHGSYRGHNNQCVLVAGPEKLPVRDVLHYLMQLLGQSMDGYSGGSYVIDSATPLWLAPELNVASDEIIIGYDAQWNVATHCIW